MFPSRELNLCRQRYKQTSYTFEGYVKTWKFVQNVYKIYHCVGQKVLFENNTSFILNMIYLNNTSK